MNFQTKTLMTFQSQQPKKTGQNTVLIPSLKKKATVSESSAEIKTIKFHVTDVNIIHEKSYMPMYMNEIKEKYHILLEIRQLVPGERNHS